MAQPRDNWLTLLRERFSRPDVVQHEITSDIFFRCSTQRMFNSLIYAVQKEARGCDFDLLRRAGMESIWRDPGGSLLRYLEHLETVFDYRDEKTFKISNLRDLSRSFVRRERGGLSPLRCEGFGCAERRRSPPFDAPCLSPMRQESRDLGSLGSLT